MPPKTCSYCGSKRVARVPDAAILTLTCKRCGATWSPASPEKEQRIDGQRRTEMEDTLLALRTAWFAFPQLRLGQLVDNAVGGSSVFYIPDAELLKRLGYAADEGGHS